MLQLSTSAPSFARELLTCLCGCIECVLDNSLSGGYPCTGITDFHCPIVSCMFLGLSNCTTTTETNQFLNPMLYQLPFLNVWDFYRVVQTQGGDSSTSTYPSSVVEGTWKIHRIRMQLDNSVSAWWYNKDCNKYSAISLLNSSVTFIGQWIQYWLQYTIISRQMDSLSVYVQLQNT